MKKIAFFVLILPLFLSAQVVNTAKDFDVEVSAPYPVVDAASKYYFTHEDKMLAIKISGAKETFQNFNTNSLDQKNITIVDKDQQPKGFVHEEFLQQGDKMFQFYNVWDKPNKTEQIFCRVFTFDKPDSPKQDKLLFKVEGKLTSAMGQNKINLYQSFDKSKILLTYRKKPTEKRDKISYDKIGMIVYDAEEMTELWNIEATMPYTEAEMDNLGYTLDSRGNAYLLARVKKGDPYLELLMFNKDNREPEKTKIEANGKYFPHGIDLQEGKNGQIICAGFYGEDRSAQGIYVSVLDKDGNIKNEKFYEIPLDIINQNKSEREQEKNEKMEEKGKDIGIYELDLDEIKVNSDGSLVLVGEVYYSITRTYYNGKTTSTQTTYYYKEMFLTKIDPDGELEWMQKLVKNQTRTENGGGGFGINAAAYSRRNFNYDLSYKYLSTGKDHYLLYLDNLKNLDLPDNKYPARHISGAGGFLTAYKVNDETGKVSKLSLFDMRDVKGIEVFQFETGRIVQPKEDEMLVELYKKKKEDILLRVNINE